MRFEPRRAFAFSKPVRRAGDDSGLPLEIAFLHDWVSDPGCLRRAAALARRENACPARVLIADGGCSEILFYLALARHLDVPYVANWPLLAAPLDPTEIVSTGRAKLADGVAPWLIAPEDVELRVLLEAREARFPLPEIAITAPSHLRAIVRLRCEPAIAYRVREALPDVAPALSAKRVADWPARAALIVVPAAAVLGLVCATRFVADLFGLVFFASMVLRLFVCAAGLDQRTTAHRPVADKDLPVYSILVPLRAETDVVPDLVAALERIDYPRAKLDVLFLVEPEDAATREALAATRLRPWCRIVAGPSDGRRLRTKPRALNVGLLFARGSLVTVYDAEDRPDSDQLRLAAAKFADSSEQLACVQARLAIANGDRSWLSRLFAIEYAALFDLFNVGTSALGLPMALGGTSNHFRTAAVRAVGGWDAWNVTEDADLGLRLARFGYAIGNLASSTMEDAPERLGAWMKQRRRWTKGWMQTLVVLARDARAVRRQYGTFKTLLVALLLTNLVTGPLLLPLFSGCVIYHGVSRGLPDPQDALRLVEATLAVSVICLGIVSTLWYGYAGVRIRRLDAFLLSVPLLLPYQLMISAAAWAGLVDLLRRPFHWHKTAHGSAARRGR